MTLTIKDAPEVDSQAKAGSPSRSSENAPGQSPRSNPVCLEVVVTLRSLPGEQSGARGSGEVSEPIREEGRTVIVFDNGAVLRISKPLPVGQTVILSNQQGRDVVCRVSGGQNLPKIKGYIEIEFIEPVDDFWHIHHGLESPRIPPAAAPLAMPYQAEPVASSTVPPESHSVAPGIEPSLGSAPSFEDIAGLVRMSPPAAVRDTKIDSSGPVVAPTTRNESALRQMEQPSPSPSASVSLPTFAPSKVKPVAVPAQESSPFAVRPPSFSNKLTGNLMSGGIQAPAQSSLAPASAETRKPTFLIVGGVALVLLGFGAGMFLMHRGSASTKVPIEAVSQPSAQSSSVTSGAPVSAPPPEAQQLAQQTPEPISTPVSVSSADREPAVSEIPKAQRTSSSAESKPPDRTTERSPSITNLKMNSPTAPRRDSARLSDGSTLGEPDIATAVPSGGAPAGALLSSVVRSETQPAPPPSAPPLVASVKRATGPILITSRHPEYPDMAKQTKVQGNVVVAFSVDAKGNVVDAKAISGPILLRQAAVNAVKQWKYTPAQFDGKPTSSQLTASLDFRLN